MDVSGAGRGLTVVNDAKYGYDVRPGDIGEMTPAQLLGCVDLFAAIHETGG